MIRTELQRILGAGKGERAVLAFLKKHPQIVLWSFITTGGHTKFVLAEFPFGSNYKADFVIAFSYSGTWELHFIELESPDDRVITRHGRPSQALNSAISQIGDWRQWMEQNPVLLRKDVSDWCMKRDLLNPERLPRPNPPSNFSGNFLKDPESSIIYNYHIVIGRRRNVTDPMRRKMNQYRMNGSLDICTHDRFLDIAKNIDDWASGNFENVYLAHTKDERRGFDNYPRKRKTPPKPP